MKLFNSLSHITQRIIIITAGFLLYGYLCRLFGFYLFWESKTLGWTLFWIAIIFVLRDIKKVKKLQNKKTLFEKIGIGFSVFVILIKGILFFATQQTTAFEQAAHYIKTNSEIKNKVGTVKGIFLVPLGAIAISTSSDGTAGQADLHFIVKGSERYIDLNLLMVKEINTDWQIEINN